jgi:predicted RNA-binding Zn ribbon-like protein
MVSSESEADPLTDMPKLIGGVLCLDFVNTVDPRHAADRRELLDSYPALVAWARHVGVIGTAQGERLLAAASVDAGQARRVLDRAIALREALYPVLAGSAAGPQSRARQNLDQLNGELGTAMKHLRVTWSAAGFGWEWDDSGRAGAALDRVLWPVAWSAADLLTRGPLDRIRECPGEGTCGWLFLDVSKNGSRRWCDMRSCGNRAKVRRHYARTRAGSRDQPGAGIGAGLPGRPDLQDR